MSKVRTFSRVFPIYHPKAGQPTYFVEKVWQALYNLGLSYGGKFLEQELENFSNPSHFITPKWHTIRAGNRWKAGDWFSPRVWSGKPYASKQIEFAPPIQIKQTIDVEIGIDAPHYTYILVPQETKDTYIMLPATDVARNDGLSFDDFQNWFKPYCKTTEDMFKGQIIIWGDVEYSGNVVKSIEV